jgi:hypothetical protein
MIFSIDPEKAFDKIQHSNTEETRNRKDVSQHNKGYI